MVGPLKTIGASRIRLHSVSSGENNVILPTTGLLGLFYADLSFTDAGQTIPAIDTDVVAALQDQSGNNEHLLQATGANKPTFIANAIGGMAALRFDGTADFMSGGSVTANQRNLAIFAVYRPTRRNATHAIASLNEGVTGSVNFFAQTSVFTSFFVSGGTTITPGTPANERYNWCPFEWNIGALLTSATETEFRINGRSRTGAAPSTQAIVGGTIFIARNPFAGQDYYGGDYAALLVYDTTGWTGSETATIEEFLQNRYSLSFTPPVNTPLYVVVGDSIGFGYDATTLAVNHHADLVVDAVGATLRNLAVAGNTVANVTAIASYINDFYNAIRPANILLIWVGTNDLVGNDPATIYASVAALCQGFKTAGWSVIVATCLPRATIPELDRTEYNDLFRDDFDVPTANSLVFEPAIGTTYADLLWDAGAHPIMGVEDANLDVALYPDGIHPGTTGQAYFIASEQFAVELLLT
jgi:lysophospholipase L1-like esterase